MNLNKEVINLNRCQIRNSARRYLKIYFKTENVERRRGSDSGSGVLPGTANLQAERKTEMGKGKFRIPA
jgi:hypothetical protein